MIVFLCVFSAFSAVNLLFLGLTQLCGGPSVLRFRIELDEATSSANRLLCGSGSWLLDLRFLLRLRGRDFLE